MRRLDESIEDLERELADTRSLLAECQAIEIESRDAAGRRADQDQVIRVLGLMSPGRRILANAVIEAVDQARSGRAERRLRALPEAIDGTKPDDHPEALSPEAEPSGRQPSSPLPNHDLSTRNV